MLNNIKLLLRITDDTQDSLLSLLLNMAKDEATAFCHLSEYDNKLDNCVLKMVVQNYNKMGNEGLSSASYGGAMSEGYLSDYSDNILTELKRHRKLILL